MERLKCRLVQCALPGPGPWSPFVRDIAREEILPRYLKTARNRKSDGSLFTEADLESQRRLEEALPGLAPGAVLGEEMNASDQARLWQEGRKGLWCIDPIDGTTNFLNGIPSLRSRPLIWSTMSRASGSSHNPVTDESFYAAKGAGAFLNARRFPCARRRRDCKTRWPAWISSESAITLATSWR